ncbi:hypothetical protein, partial [Treponema endosymbiont of Eucomonympha sp.]|uniref:hypothetical protein n=1 Tax=Treponema endosymbiont of Eucomonympha sp. TaxID=1580831 RepID=UPI001EE69C0E
RNGVDIAGELAAVSGTAALPAPRCTRRSLCGEQFLEGKRRTSGRTGFPAFFMPRRDYPLQIRETCTTVAGGVAPA